MKYDDDLLIFRKGKMTDIEKKTYLYQGESELWEFLRTLLL